MWKLQGGGKALLHCGRVREAWQRGLPPVCQLQPAPAAGTLLVKDGSHSAHERFFQTACVLPPEERSQVKDWCAWS